MVYVPYIPKECYFFRKNTSFEDNFNFRAVKTVYTCIVDSDLSGIEIMHLGIGGG